MGHAKPVVCTYCNETIYDYIGPAERVSLKAEFFVPRRDFPKPDARTRLVCPNCGERWTAISKQVDSIRMAIDPATRGSGTVKY